MGINNYGSPNQVTLDNSPTECSSNKSRPISVHAFKNISHFTELCLRHLLGLKGKALWLFQWKQFSFFAVTGIAVSISYSKEVHCLLQRMTRSAHVSHRRYTIFLWMCSARDLPEIKTVVDNDENFQVQSTYDFFTTLQNLKFFQIT